MIFKTPLLILFVFLLFTPVFGQTPSPSPSPQRGTAPSDEVVRITTNLVQIDVVVTDKDGIQVTDLVPEDFEITEGNKKQEITNFSHVSVAPTASVSRPANDPAIKDRKPVAPAPLRPEQVHRTIALVVDDLGLSFESVVFTREALRKFVNQQMQPNDLVAILRTSRGIGSLQQFTSDKRQLLDAVDNISWHPAGRGGLSPGGDIDTQIGQDSTQGAQFINEMEEARAAAYSVGTIQTLSRILQGLKDLPGRKVLMLYSESFMLFTSQGRNVQLLDALEKLTDRANQSSTVFYTIDASGLNPLGLTASDRVSGSGPYAFPPDLLSGGVIQPRNRIATRRIDSPQSASAQAETDSAAAFRRLEGLMQQKENSQNQAHTVLSLLAEQTGGTFTKNTNDLSLGAQRMLENESGYYLIGYHADESTIDRTGARRLRDVKIKLKRPGLRVRSRSGFYGVNMTAESGSAPRTRDQRLTAALTSPFVAGGIGVRITPIFANDAKEGSYMRVLLHLDTKTMTFSPQPDGSHKAVLDLVAVSYGSEGRIEDQFADTQTINVSADAYQQMLKDGLIFILNLPTKKTGPLQVRVAVHDAASQRVGSANQYVQVPDLNSNRLALSGIYVTGTRESPAGGGGEAKTEADPLAGPAVRRLKQGMILNYFYTIYNPQLDGGRPQLQTQMKLFRDGKEAFAGKVLPFNPGQQTDMKRLEAGGRLLVGNNLVPGSYVLQVTVTDTLAKNKRQSVTTQWLDFEIVK